MLTSDGSFVPVPAWSFPEGIELVQDTGPATWVAESLGRYPWATVGSVVPDGFEAYARILHPAYRTIGTYEQEPVTWAEVAAMTGRRLHPLAQFSRIAGIEDLNGRPEWGQRPPEGDLPVEVATALCPALAGFTQTADRCWFCVWVGWGDLYALEGYDEESYPHVEMPGREYLLLRGSMDLVSQIGRDGGNDPSIWWPDDRTWCVATEIDLDSTFVGGTAECIARLMDEPALEVMPASLEDRVDYGSDTINT